MNRIMLTFWYLCLMFVLMTFQDFVWSLKCSPRLSKFIYYYFFLSFFLYLNSSGFKTPNPSFVQDFIKSFLMFPLCYWLSSTHVSDLEVKAYVLGTPFRSPCCMFSSLLRLQHTHIALQSLSNVHLLAFCTVSGPWWKSSLSIYKVSIKAFLL